MYKTISTLLLGATGFFCFGQTSVWKITKNNHTLYLGGTVHILREQDYPLPVEFDFAFSNSQTIVFEADLTEINNPMVAQKIVQNSIYTDERTLESELRTDVYEMLKQECLKLNLSLERFAKYKPPMVVLTIANLKMNESGMSSEGVDKYFYDKALQNDKSIEYLESVDQQIDLITEIGQEDVNEFVLYSLNDLNDIGTNVDSLVDSWRGGKSDVMQFQIDQLKTDYPQMYHSLMVQRNNSWFPQIEALITQDSTSFILVGAMHLHGNDGLLHMLKKCDYMVEQVIATKE